MSQPTPYERLYSFTDYQTVNPANPLPATELDAELNAIALTAGQIRANLGLIQRDDGALANQTVTPDSLSAGALAMIHQGEYLPRGAWIAARAFALGDVVTYNAATYLCIVAHTSVTQFATDLAAGKWLLIANGALAGGGQAVDLFEGNGSTATFALSFTYNGNNAAVVFVGGVAQIPGQDFTISGSSITFVSAPPAPAVAGRKNVMVRGTGIEAQLAADGAATAAANASASATAAANSATAANASQSAAATSAANAATSATSAAGSATTATTKASEATTSASAAAASQTAAAASQTAAATSATNAANSATAAAGSATTATNQATTATNQATAAANSATAASNSATAAAGSASTASGAATTATNQASAASTSATAASTSASNAANSASQAATSASNAAASASSASSSASSANTSAVNAATSATNASNSATAAGTSAAAASTSATNAANSATTATTQATNASNSATAAAGSASAAAASAAAAAASLDSFDDRYLGSKTSDPTTDNDGNALITGALYFNSVAGEMRVWAGSFWKTTGSSVGGTINTAKYTATAGQTAFAIVYDVGFVHVYLNGLKLESGVQFTANDGTSVVLATGATAGDVVDMIAFGIFSVANTYTKAEADALLGAKAPQATTYTKTEVDTALAGKQASLGYTPVNKAGDTMSGSLYIDSLLRLRRSDDTRYRVDLQSGPGGNASLNSYDDTTLQYKTFSLEQSEFFVNTGVSSTVTRLKVDSVGNRSSVIPSGSTLYPEFVCRAWVNFNGTGTVEIRASGNVSSITDNGVGDYTMNFSNAMPDANYCAVANGDRSANPTSDMNNTQLLHTYATGSVRLKTGYPQGLNTLDDSLVTTVAVFR